MKLLTCYDGRELWCSRWLAKLQVANLFDHKLLAVAISKCVLGNQCLMVKSYELACCSKSPLIWNPKQLYRNVFELL